MFHRLLASTATLVLAVAALGATGASAATFTVTSTADDGAGTLRAAIASANADGGSDIIGFSDLLAGDGLISLETALPAATGLTTIDGTTHPDGWVTLDGTLLASGDGLRLSGGTSTVKGMRISGFPGNGIALDTLGGNTIQGNEIGRTPSGPNHGAAIAVASSNNTIGGIAAGEANDLGGFSSNDTVSVVGAGVTGNRIRGNTFVPAGQYAVDLGTDGMTANDALDADTGANGQQNSPVLTAMTSDFASASFTGTLHSKANADYTLDFYLAQGCGGSNAAWVGTANVHTDGSGNAAFSPSFLSTSGQRFGLATATDSSGDTSELSIAQDADGDLVTGVSAGCEPLDVAQAIAADPTTVTGATYLAIPPESHPNGVGTTALGGFPTHGATFGILSSGIAARLTPQHGSGGDIGGGNQRGDTDQDVSILRVGLNVPQAANCLTLDFRFLSDEYPSFVGSSFNDAFIAELDTTTWATSGSAITAPANFAFDPSGDVISINSTGATAMSAAEAAGTGFEQNGATPLLHASKIVTPGAHQLYLSLFDQGDGILDSAVELDNLRFSTREAAACASGATSDTTPPVVTLVNPADASSTADTTPTYDGAAGTATGDLDTITVKIYSGTTTGGTLVDTLTTQKSTSSWAVDGTTPLAPGTYTAQAQQSDASGNTGFSLPHTFTVTSSNSLSVDDATVTEGNAGTTNAAFHVTLAAPAAGTVTVHYATSNGTAVQPGDYTSTSGDLTFDPGQTSKTVDVPVVGDTLDEDNESYTLVLSAQTNASISDGSGLGTITDDDSPPAVSIGDQTVTEGSAPGTVNATFAVTLSGASGKGVSVHWATANGTATQPADYTAVTDTTLTFAAGETSKSVTVVVKGDALDEDDETFTVGLSSPANATLGDASGTGTITDDDTPPTLTINDRSQVEGNTGTSTMTFTVSLSAASGRTVTVHRATADGTATAGSDYVALSDATLTFAAGETSKSVAVTINGDTTNEANETFTLGLATPTNATIADGSGQGIIDNDDFPSVSIGDATMVTEGNGGSTNADFTVTLSSPSVQTTSVHWASANGTAVAPGDHGTASGDLTFTPGQTTKQVSVPVLGDTLDEDDETFTVVLSVPVFVTIGDSTGLGTILDDDGPPSVSVSDQTVTEGNSGTTAAVFTVALSAASGRTVTVHGATADGTAGQPGDYAAGSGDVTFAPGQTSQTFSVAVNGDTTVEPDETFTVTLSAPANATLGTAAATGTIINDDTVTPPLVPSISIGGATVDPEGDTGTKPATFTVSLSAATTATVTVKYATANGTASAPADYAAGAGTLAFAPGETSKAVVVQVAGDTLVEGDETFRVQLSDPVAGTLASASGTGTVVDDDKPPVVKPPGGVDDGAVFCGRQHRGACKGLQFTAQFATAPGNASWTFDAYNPNPGKGRASGAAITYVRMGTLKKAIRSKAPVKVTFKVKGRKADANLRRIRKGKLTRLRITTTFTSSAGKKTKTVSVVKLR